MKPSVGDAPRRGSRNLVLATLVVCTVAVNGAFVANQILPMAERWYFGLGVYTPWPASMPFFGEYWLSAWLLGAFVPGLVTAYWLTRSGGQRWLRGLAACFGLGCLALIILILWLRLDEAPIPLVHIAGLSAGVAVAAVVVFGKLRPVRERRSRSGLLALTTCFTLLLGIPTFLETWAEYQPQDLPDFDIEMVAAYPIQEWTPTPGRMPAIVVDENKHMGEIVEYGGARFNIHRKDRLRISSRRVERVRWHDGDELSAYISVRPDRHVASRLRSRSVRRMSQYDALFVNGELVMILPYEAVMIDRLWLEIPNRDEHRRLYETLTGQAR